MAEICHISQRVATDVGATSARRVAARSAQAQIGRSVCAASDAFAGRVTLFGAPRVSVLRPFETRGARACAIY
eukprot:6178284-Pleurochrysis_carterae.AAC.2